jgi:hypothetical protein
MEFTKSVNRETLWMVILGLQRWNIIFFTLEVEIDESQVSTTCIINYKAKIHLQRLTFNYRLSTHSVLELPY